MTAPDVTAAERLADLRQRIHGLVELPQLSADELACIELVIHGIVRGREVYGSLDVATDARDMRREALEELRDTMTYSAAAMLRLQRGR